MGVSSTVRREFTAAGISYEVVGSGGLLVVTKSGTRCEFWPASGKWINPAKSGNRGYGLRSLIHYLTGTHDSNGRSK